MIVTKRAKLRRFHIEDLENMQRLESEPDIMKFTPSKVPQTKEQSLERLKKTIARADSPAPFGVWAAETHDQKFIGWFMLIQTDLLHPELGFMIVKEFWSQGLTTEISLELIKNLRGISARTTADNSPSIRVLEKCGFKFLEEKLNQSGDLIKFFERSDTVTSK